MLEEIQSAGGKASKKTLSEVNRLCEQEGGAALGRVAVLAVFLASEASIGLKRKAC
ncbi:hypothetical protein ACFLUS_05970 [Chloroflexota bacterium]